MPTPEPSHKQTMTPEPNPSLDLGPEWAMVEAVARGASTPADAEWFRKLLTSGTVDIGRLLEVAMRQKMAFQLVRFLEAYRLEWELPGQVSYSLPLLLSANRYRNDVLRREATRIAAALRCQGVRFVLTKGIILESAVHGGGGGRAMNDVDLMIGPDDRQKVTQVLEALGYRKGHYHRELGTEPLDRRTTMLYELHPDHLPHFVRSLGDTIVPFISVDVANSLTWHDSPWQIPVEVALERSRPHRLPGTEDPVPAMDPAVGFLFTALHLFREAWFEHSMRSNTDVNLAKFWDMHMSWAVGREEIVGGGFVELLDRYGLHDPVLWVLEHLDGTLGTGVCEALGLSGRVSEEWLHSAGKGSVQHARWRGTMRERLHSRDRASLLVDPEREGAGAPAWS